MMSRMSFLVLSLCLLTTKTYNPVGKGVQSAGYDPCHRGIKSRMIAQNVHQDVSLNVFVRLLFWRMLLVIVG